VNAVGISKSPERKKLPPGRFLRFFFLHNVDVVVQCSKAPQRGHIMHSHHGTAQNAYNFTNFRLIAADHLQLMAKFFQAGTRQPC